MPQDRVQPGTAFAGVRAAPFTLLLTAIFCTGCASPGPPKPPSLRLPQPVEDLSAERTGDHVLLRWTTPSRTTDDMDIKGPLTAELCREAAPAARPAACAPVRRLSVVPGPSEVADTLPSALQADPVMLLAYRIQIFNAAGRSAGESAAAYAAAGLAPSGVVGLHATPNEQGAVLEWRRAPVPDAETVDLQRGDLLPAPPPAKRPAPAAIRTPGKAKSSARSGAGDDTPNETHLRAAENAVTAGTVDTTAAMGHTYSYSAQRIRAVSIGGRPLEIRGEPSPAVTLALKDVFPPKPPTGLETISGTATANSAEPPANSQTGPYPYIDLSWEPNSEPDLVGYRVYRQLARPDGSPQGPLARLTPLPIAVPAYRDVAVKAGQGYIYTVTAVDADGNESPPSAKALEAVP